MDTPETGYDVLPHRAVERENVYRISTAFAASASIRIQGPTCQQHEVVGEKFQ